VSLPGSARGLATLTGLHLVLWFAAHAPALGPRWWFLDDYTLADVLSRGNVGHHLGQGRPGQLLWMLTFFVDAVDGRGAASIAIRLLQGLLHSAAAALVALVLFRTSRRPATLACGLPFVLWPMSGETTLWRAAGEYPLAAALAAWGCLLLCKATPGAGRLGPAALVTAAVLTHQLAAGSGLVAFGLVVALAACGVVPMDRGRLTRQLGLLIGAYLAGGLASLSIARLTPFGDDSRLAFPTDAEAKLAFLGRAIGMFLTSPVFYPPALVALQLVLIALALAAIAWPSRTWPWRRRWLALAGLASAAVTPYAAQLAVADSQIAWRSFYLSPWLLGGAFALADTAPAAPPWLRRAAAGVLGAVVLGYLPIAWAASSVYPRLYRADQGLLREIEARSRHEQIPRVHVDVETPPLTMDPFGLDPRWGGAKLSVFLSEASRGLLSRSPGLVPVVADDAGSLACRERCRAEPRSASFRLFAVPVGPTLCVCPP
jgi:hypothetical protein